ncbi:Vacuolar protein sorting-associated protein [Kluyveromyces marxianus]
MLESLVSALLNRFLGAYVENFDPKQLNVGIWNGDVKLRNLRLRKDSLDALDLPVDVKFGHLGELTLLIPWSSLKNKPVKIIIEDVYMLCTPRTAESYCFQDQVERELKVKLQRLAELELSNSSKPDMNPESNRNESFTQSLLTKIIDNLQVTVRNIHLRYEDANSIFSEKPCAFGISLSELSAVSTDESWNPSFIAIKQQITHKLATLDSISFYLNTSTESIDIDDKEELLVRLRESIADKHGTPEYQYLLKPVKGSARLKMNNAGATQDTPHIDVQLMFDQFALVLDDCQYKEVLHNMSKYHWFHKTLKFRRFRPTCEPKEDPIQWFRYAANCVLSEIHEKNYRSSWEYIKKRRQTRDEYVALFKKKLTLPNITDPLPNPDDETRLIELDRDLEFDDIKFFRAFARRQFSQESKVTRMTETVSTNSNPQGWFSSWWGSGSNKSDDTLTMTDEQRKELYEAIEYDDSKDALKSIDIPRDRTTVRVTNLLQKGSLTIIDKTKGHRMCDFIFEESATEFLKRPDSFLLKFELNSFLVEDGSPHTSYRHIISPRANQESSEPLLHLCFDSYPMDDSADSFLDVKFGSVFVYYHIHFINELLRFFNPPKKHWETISAIMNAAEATVEGWTTQTRMGLEAMLDEHKTIDVNLNAASPTIIIPLDAHSWESPCAIIDAGSIKMRSDLVPKEEIKKIKELSVDEYAKIDSAELKRLMFDRFKIKLTNTQFLIGPDMKSAITSINVKQTDNNFTILEKMELDFIFDVLIFPKAMNLPKARASVTLPNLNLFLNDAQYKIIMQLIERCTPYVEEDDDDDNNGDSSSSDSFSQLIPIDNASDRNQALQNLKQALLLKQTKKMLDKLSKTELEQVSFELTLDVSRIEISLSKCLEGSTMRSTKLVKLVGEHLSLGLEKRFVQLGFNISLTELRLEDHISNFGSTNREEYILFSNNSTKQPNLFDINGSRTQQIIEYESKLYEVFDINVDLKMSELTLSLIPKSILTLLNFILNTFTDPGTPTVPANVIRQSNQTETDSKPGSTNVNLLLDGINIILNDESSRLATLGIHNSELSINMLPQSMKVKAKLGDMKLLDETSVDLPKNSIFRELISREDDDLAELVYETFDPETNKNNYDSYLFYRTGAMRINFVEHSINKIINVFAKFQKMKVFFDTAHNNAYSKAPDIDTVNNIKFDILIKTPTISFPKLIDPRNNSYDELIWKMGDVYLSNYFTGDDNKLVNNASVGIKNTHISSIFNFEGNMVQQLSAVSNLDLRFDILYDQYYKESEALLNITGFFAPFYVNLTDLQIQYILGLVQKISSSFIVDQVNDDMEDIEMTALNTNSIIDPQKELHLSQNIFSPEKKASEVNIKSTRVEFEFNAPEVSLSLYNHTKGALSIDELGVARFNLEDFGISGSALNSSSFESEMHITSFTVEDIRYSKTSKHTQVIPKIEGEHHQFMASFNYSEGKESSNLTFEVTIDSPKIVLATEFILSLQDFLTSSFTSQQPANLQGLAQHNNGIEPDQNDETSELKNEKNKMSISYSINVVDSAVILLADPADSHSEAIVFTIGQFLIANQNVLSISANNVGLFLSRMGTLKTNRIRVLDDFSSTILIDGRDSTPEMLKTQIHSSVGPLMLRLSLRDIGLAMRIFDSALSMAKDKGLISKTDSEKKEDDINTKYGRFSKEFKNKIKKYAPSMVSSFSELSNAIQRNSVHKSTKIIAKAEKLHLDFAGMRIVLIGDIHELPIADFNVNSFSVDAKDWSTNIDAISTIEMYASAFNYSRSSWEPLIEVFPLTFHLSKDDETGNAFMFDIIARKNVEITLSSRTIALLSQIPASLTKVHDLKPRGAERPYRIRNDTGHPLNIWIKNTEDGSPGKKTNLTKLEQGAIIDWEFEDWRVVRETLNTDKNILQVSFDSEVYTNVIEVDATKEGETVHMLYPPVNGVHNRLLVGSKLLKNNVKQISFGSTLLFFNSTSTEIEVGLFDKAQTTLIKTIEPRETKAIPIDLAYNSSFQLRPKISGAKYQWSKTPLFWKLLREAPNSLTCASESNAPPFYFEAEGLVEKDDPLSKIYPRMTVSVSAPLVLENLLPENISFCLMGKEDKHSQEMYLEAGSSIPLHNVSLESYLFLSVKPDDDIFQWSNETLVNSPDISELQEEYRTLIKTVDGQKLYLNLKYHSDGRRAKTISIYAPYVILNKTTHDLSVFSDRQWGVLKSNVFLENDKKVAKPKMFSFQYEDYNRNRAKIKFTETNPSFPVSFDAIGQSVDVSLELLNHDQECNLGISVKEGEGKYRFTKIVELCPRYIFRNSMQEYLEIMEYGTSSPTLLGPNEVIPLYFLKRTLSKKFVARFAKIPSTWSNPFRLKDVGETFVKMNITDAAQRLVKMEISLEGATLFINATDSDDNWPYSIRNFSDNEFLFWQRNPRFVDEESDELDYYYQEDEDEVDFEPIYYRIPPRSVMPYSWDYPSAKQKKLYIHTKNRRREIDLNEIGNLRPIRIPPDNPKNPPTIVDINILMDNGVQVLVLSNYNQEQSLYKLRSQRRLESESSLASSVTSKSDRFEVDEDMDSKLNARVVLSFSGIGVSFINQRLQELCYLNILGLEFRFNDSEMYQNLSFKIKWLQIDNQLFGGIYETVLYPTKIPKESKEIDIHPSLSGSISKVKDESSSLMNFKMATILLQEMTIQIDEDFLFALIDFVHVPGAAWNENTDYDDNNNEAFILNKCSIPDFPTTIKSNKVYFEMLHLQPTLLHLSFVRTDRVNVEEEKTSGNSPINYFINVLTMALGNIEGAQIKLNSLLLEHVRVSPPTLIAAIESHYAQQFFYQLHKILGSADFLGNPVGFFNNISSGVMDIFYEPYQGYIMNDRPQELGIGIAKGGLSFLKKSVFGFSDSFSKMTGSMAKGLSVAIQDTSFQERRRLQQRQRGKFGSVGVGASSFFNNVTSGITGVALDPYSGGAKEGPLGFIKGVGKGLIGLPAKTAIGVLDLASNVSEGIRNSTTLMDGGQIERVRLPRYVGSDNLIKPYNLRDSQGQYWLKSCNGGQFAKDIYVGHVICETPAGFQIVIVSLQRILRMQLSNLTVMEHIPFNTIRNVKVSKTGITIYTAEREYFFSVPKDEERRYLYKLVHAAVVEFNSKWQVQL